MATSPVKEQPLPLERGLTAVAGLRVGHAEMADRPTGCTVVLTDGGAVAGVDVRGGAPGSRELALLDPAQTVEQVHAAVLAGGSAFGLATATGVVDWLAERKIGFPTGGGPVPIVPAIILYDLEVGGRADVRPDADCGRRACDAAGDGPVAEGSVGAGAGATVGKLLGATRAMRGGLGTAALRTTDGHTVAALVAVNALGDVVDPRDGRLVAGARGDDGKPVDARRLVRSGGGARSPLTAGQNTTIGIIATDAPLSKAGATRLARMGHDGFARTLYPAHTPFDGDALIALATGRGPRLEDPMVLGQLGTLAAEAVAEAILRGVRRATPLPGFPTAEDAPSDRGDTSPKPPSTAK
ncbi:MAG: P1 family peptidase [Acidobacteriota bacterium]